jgi:peptidoglycan hydrolase-like protein with peptidoglycan-binding domain
MATVADIGQIHLTSPAMDGPQVRRAQRALLHNPYGTFDPGPLDGVYGERTAAAVRRAKYWIGYPEQRIDQICDADLLALLTDEAPHPSSYKATRTKRLHRAQDAHLWSAAYDAAISCVGDREAPPGSHRCEWSDWYGVPGPWCAMFLSWCYVQAGSTAFEPGRRYAYVPHLLSDAQRGANQLSITRTPLTGDLAIFDLDGDGIPDHAGMFDRWLDDEETRYQTVEGNVSLSGEPNGGRVLQRERFRKNTFAFVHVRG